MALNKNNNKPIIRLIIIGTLAVSILLLGLLLLHDILIGSGMRYRSYVVIGAILYIAAAYYAYRSNHLLVSSWMILSLYLVVMSAMLLFWGLNAPIGILSVTFALLLPGILFGPKAIIFVSIGVTFIISTIQSLHSLQILSPHIHEINAQASLWDTVAYIVAFSIFGLLSWLSSNRTKDTLRRATIAENSIREQRDTIRLELEEEYARARRNKLIEVERLYKFATLGQSTAATLHELSNHLSVLNMDIDDLTQQHKNSKAIMHARESITHINNVLRHIKRRLNIAQKSDTSFLVIDAIHTALQDVRKKLQERSVTLNVDIPNNINKTILHGDSQSWSHIITILITNALEACQDLVQPKVLLKASVLNDTLIVHVMDNGVGIPPERQKDLFQPVYSTKPNGMGIGLYITKHMIKSQFNGTIKYNFINPKTTNQSPFKSGSKFTIKVPLNPPTNNHG